MQQEDELTKAGDPTGRDDLRGGDEKAPAPGPLAWPFKRAWWAIESHLLWPVADFFRAIGSGFGRIFEPFRYRSPLAYIGATALVMLTLGAVATAWYFYGEAGRAEQEATIASQVPEAPVVLPVTPPTPIGNDETLQGVTPDFKTSSGKSKLPEEAVEPAEAPKQGPLKVAHSFATSFVDYEVGEKGSARALRKSTTPRLAKELTARPPRLPESGQVPKAQVLNVVEGPSKGKRLEVSVALMRSGAASELRLAMTKDGPRGWLVTEVRG